MLDGQRASGKAGGEERNRSRRSEKEIFLFVERALLIINPLSCFYAFVEIVLNLFYFGNKIGRVNYGLGCTPAG